MPHVHRSCWIAKRLEQSDYDGFPTLHVYSSRQESKSHLKQFVEQFLVYLDNDQTVRMRFGLNLRKCQIIEEFFIRTSSDLIIFQNKIYSSFHLLQVLLDRRPFQSNTRITHLFECRSFWWSAKNSINDLFQSLLFHIALTFARHSITSCQLSTRLQNTCNN